MPLICRSHLCTNHGIVIHLSQVYNAIMNYDATKYLYSLYYVSQVGVLNEAGHIERLSLFSRYAIWYMLLTDPYLLVCSPRQIELIKCRRAHGGCHLFPSRKLDCQEALTRGKTTDIFGLVPARCLLGDDNFSLYHLVLPAIY